MEITIYLADYTIILNALHYYKKVEKQGNFKLFTDDVVNDLRDRLASQVCPSPFNAD